MIGAINAETPESHRCSPGDVRDHQARAGRDECQRHLGRSKDVQFLIKAPTLRLTEGGGAVVTSRANMRDVINGLHEWFHERIEFYRAKGELPLTVGRDPLLRAR
ncbi:hypothetical protein GS498_04160 [Rhodococcus hoagii]|nr:hypothetical protein [Prescottella equi]